MFVLGRPPDSQSSSLVKVVSTLVIMKENINYNGKWTRRETNKAGQRRPRNQITTPQKEDITCTILDYEQDWWKKISLFNSTFNAFVIAWMQV